MIFKIYPLPSDDVMVFTGSNILDINQNRVTPFLDLLVRESIQNSLDAAHADADYVSMKFLIKKFNSLRLLEEFEGIKDGVKALFPEEYYDYIAIRDYNCEGLIGELNPYNRVDKSGIKQNLYNLVYDVMKAQKNPDAGGSWGIGKTIYYKIGIGLVIYYSRIRVSNSEFQERMVAVLIENELDHNKIYKLNNNYRGIAFFGEPIKLLEDNKTIPIIDEAKIQKILNIFNIERYVGDQTGTTVIVPYINQDNLLSDKREEKERYPYWEYSLEKKLQILIQKWYFPRIEHKEDQKKFFEEPYLKVTVNDFEINYENMEPFFQELKCLYTKTYCINKLNTKIKELSQIDLNDQGDITSKIIDINDFSIAVGAFASKKFNKQDLKMIEPYNNESPYMYIDANIDNDRENPPIIMYTRKPGMVISYEVGEKPWVDPTLTTSNDEYILGIFTLNSNNQERDKEGRTIEEYFRNSERSDHLCWSDIDKSYYKKITNKVRKSLNETYKKDDNEDLKEHSHKLSKYLGDLLLPPEDFGTKPSGSHGPRIGEGGGKTSKFKYTIISDSQLIRENIIDFILNVKITKELESIGVLWLIATAQKNYTRNEWEEMELVFPLELTQIAFSIKKRKNNPINDDRRITRFVSKNLCVETKDGIILKTIDTDSGPKGLSIDNLKGTNIAEFELMLRFKIVDNKINVAFKLES